MTERTNQRICINAPAHSTALMQAFIAKHSIIEVCQHPYSPDLVPCDFWGFPKAKFAVEIEKIVECDSHTAHKLSQRRLTAD